MHAVDCPPSRARLIDEPGPLLEVAVDLYPGLVLLDSVRVRVLCPRKGRAGAKRLVPPGQGGVDDVLAVAADGHEAAVGRVLQALRVDFRATELAHRHGQSLAVRDALICVAAAGWISAGGEDLEDWCDSPATPAKLAVRISVFLA